MICVRKRDETLEPFDRWKLTGSIWRAMQETQGSYEHARRLCEAAQIYLKRGGEQCVSSRALFEMMLKALRYVGLEEAAESAEAFHKWRNALRTELRIRHDGGAVTYWEKGWVCEFASRSWNISRSVGRLVAGKIELELLLGGERTVWRGEVIEQLNRLISEYGLADAVPVGR